MENKMIRELYARWRFNADLMTCNECGYSVIATRMHETAHHAAGCKHAGERNPWLQLAEILEALKVGAGETAKPAAWIRFCSDGGYEGPLADCDKRMDDARRKSGAWTPLFATPNLK